MKTNVKKLVINSLLLAIGALFHQITPPMVLGMKPDFSLSVLLIILILNDDYKSLLAAGIVSGIISAATTGFPGGQIPNFIEKVITVNIMYFLLIPFRNYKPSQIKVVITTIIGTLISGTFFLLSALMIVGLPTSFKVLFVSVVLPATLLNALGGAIIFKAVLMAYKATKIPITEA